MNLQAALIRGTIRQGCRLCPKSSKRRVVLNHRCFATSGSSSSSSSAFTNAAAASKRQQHDWVIEEEPQQHPPSSTESSHFRSPVVPYPLSPKRSAPEHIAFPPYAKTGRPPLSLLPEKVLIHDDASIHKMRNAAQLARKVLDYACELAVPGVTTDTIDKAVHDEIIQHGAYPSPLNYHGFPKSLCSSINEVICHGIPDTRPLQLGDVVSFDVSCFLDGVHGDNCATVIVGDSSDQPQSDNAETDWRGVPYKTHFDSLPEREHFETCRRLVRASRESLYAAIETCKPGGCLSHIGNAIHDVADAYGFDTVEKYRGHGISHDFHCMPYVKHYRNRERLELVPGMIFTIEPMLTEGSAECEEWDDAWTVVTVDGGLAAQFEHTVLITDTDVEILTLPPTKAE